MYSVKPFNCIISGGGTGGHIYPAIAIGKALEQATPVAKIVFVGALGKMEMEKVPQAGFPIHGLWISGWHRGQRLRNLLFPIKLMVSLLQAFLLWLRYRPKVVVGTGGFASGPMVYVSRLMGSKVLIQEQNSYAGMTNRFLGKKAHCIAVAYPKMDQYFPAEKMIFTGNPVRQAMMDQKESKEKALASFGFKANKKTILVIGGSLGAASINQLIENNVSFFAQQHIQVIWQCGNIYYEKYKHLADDNTVVLPFIQAMDLAYSSADFIISRAGAASISEISLVGKPALLIPSPNVAENHQYHNAKALADQNAACLIEEKDLATFPTVFLDLLADEKRQEALVENLQFFARPHATQEIVTHLLKLHNNV